MIGLVMPPGQQERENRFVVIGRALDRESITDCVMACQVSASTTGSSWLPCTSS